MQDPERPEPQQPAQTGTLLQPHSSPTAIALDEETLARELFANRASDMLLKATIHQIEEQIKRALEQGGDIEVHKEDGIATVTISLNGEIIRVVASGNRIKTIHIDERTQPDGSFGDGIVRERGLDKSRIAWPREWPTDVMAFHNNQQGLHLKVIITGDKTAIPPTGWIESQKPQAKAIPNGTVRLLIPKVFTKEKGGENLPPKKVDIYCHKGFIVIVPSGQQDISKAEVMETGTPQDP